MNEATRDSIVRRVKYLGFIAIFLFGFWGLIGGDPFGIRAAQRDRVSELACMVGGNFWVEGKCQTAPDQKDKANE